MNYIVGKDYWFIHAEPKPASECVGIAPWVSCFNQLKVVKMTCVKHSQDNDQTTYEFTSPHQMSWHASCKNNISYTLYTIKPDIGNKSTPIDSMMELQFYMDQLKLEVSTSIITMSNGYDHQNNLYNEIRSYLFKTHDIDINTFNYS